MKWGDDLLWRRRMKEVGGRPMWSEPKMETEVDEGGRNDDIYRDLHAECMAEYAKGDLTQLRHV